MREFLSKTKKSRPRKGRIVYVALVAVGVFLVAAASRNLYAVQQEDNAARSEYDMLRDIFYQPSATADVSSSTAGDNITVERDSLHDSGRRLEGWELSAASIAPGATDMEVPAAAQPRGSGAEGQPLLLDRAAALAELNTDYVGWITVSGMGIDYPVVRGNDNEHYLDVTFTGRSNPAGAIFLDYRNKQGFDEPVCIIYGHNMRDGSMFASLNRYLDESCIAAFPEITITTTAGDTLLYRIFAAERADKHSMAYALLDFDEMRGAMPDSAPEGASMFLLLSTCTSGADKDERMLVYAAPVEQQ